MTTTANVRSARDDSRDVEMLDRPATELLYPGFVRIDEEVAGEDRDVIVTATAALLLQPGVF